MRRRVWTMTVVVLGLLAAACCPLVPGHASTDDLRSRLRALHDPGAYPERGFGQVKGLQPDFWPVIDDLAPGMSTVAFNLYWAEWEPVRKAAPCAAGEVTYDGYCFRVPARLAADLAAYTERGVAVTAVVYGTPAWARRSRPCVPVGPGFEVFCVPDHPADYARFAGLIARYFDGRSGRGRITDFVVQNEVNMNQWFNVGCGVGVPCDLDRWVADYARLYNGAYDAIRSHQPRARVLFSFTHHFETRFDSPELDHPVYSIKTFLPRLVPLVGRRAWSIALHPYPPNISSTIDARDLPYATLGNLGVVPGCLRATYPHDPHAWEVQLTEVGLANHGPFDAAQRDALCQSFRNVLGTPGITSFVYHRLLDHPDEGILKLGLRRQDGTPKPAFDLWRHVNEPGAERCGFELRGHTVVRHGLDPVTGASWYSSRALPRGYVPQPESWRLSWSARPGTTLLHECGTADERATYLSRRSDCGGDTPMGPVGWIARFHGRDRIPLVACRVAGATSILERRHCPDGGGEWLGYATPHPGADR